MEGRKKRKLKNYLLNRRFQLKYTSMVVGMAAVLSVALGWVLYGQMQENSRMLHLEAEFDPVFKAQLEATDAKALAQLVGALVAFNVALTLGSIFITHRMAGPDYVLRRYVRAVAEGRLPDVRPLRKGDELVELHQGLRHMVESLRERTTGDIEAMERALAALRDQAPEETGPLQHVLAQKRQSVQALSTDAGVPAHPADGSLDRGGPGA